jgi:hypothetical protein
MSIAKIVAERLGRAPSTIKSYVYDPSGEKARAVKARYVGVCRGCGAYTQPRNGKGDAYAYCKRCHAGAVERRWTRERVLDALLQWRARYGRLPLSYDWSRTRARRRGRAALERLGGEEWPAASVVGRLFGTWAAARTAACVENVDSPQTCGRSWSSRSLPRARPPLPRADRLRRRLDRRQRPVGNTGRHEPQHPDPIIDAELERAIEDPDPLRGIAQLAARGRRVRARSRRRHSHQGARLGPNGSQAPRRIARRRERAAGRRVGVHAPDALARTRGVQPRRVRSRRYVRNNHGSRDPPRRVKPRRPRPRTSISTSSTSSTAQPCGAHTRSVLPPKAVRGREDRGRASPVSRLSAMRSAGRLLPRVLDRRPGDKKENRGRAARFLSYGRSRSLRSGNWLRRPEGLV